VVTQLVRGLHNIPPQWQGAVVTIGNFDGVHKGHQALLAKVKAKADSLNVPAVVVVFEPQPAEFFANNKLPTPRLTRLREKFHALANLQMDAVLVLRFNEKFANLTADQFINQVLSAGLKARHVIVGADFQFGKGRAGNVNFLTTRGAESGFTVETMPDVLIDGERVSSTLVRQALAAGQEEVVQRLLGRPYVMEGRVVYGDQRGRTIGFPTANILLRRKATPVHGVYVVRMYGIAPQGIAGVANVGERPTVDGKRTLLEVHLFDFSADIYHRQVRVEFCKKLRDEQRFENFDLLKEQIWRDATAARAYFLEI
jgi:riboflavin kinase / FMN adenylyltransferase